MGSGSNVQGKSISNALENQKRASTARGRAQLGAFAVEGLRLVRRGLRAGLKPRQLLLGESVSAGQEAQQLRALVANACVVDDQQLLSLCQGRSSGLFQALFEMPGDQSLAQVIQANANALILVLLQVEDPGNVGALIRTALASGAHAVVCAGGTDPFHPKAVRTSLGSLFRISLVCGGEPRAGGWEPRTCLEALHHAGVHTLATTPRGGQGLLTVALPSGPLALLMGNEGQGLSEKLQSQARQSVSIEQSDLADSYSVNAAAAICLFEIFRRRRFPT